MPRKSKNHTEGEDVRAGDRRVVEAAAEKPVVPKPARGRRKAIPEGAVSTKPGIRNGDTARAAEISDRRRKEIARGAARARWGKSRS
ncbi:MAG: hypothetical protein HY650_11545 [Acidobacteria bacterium]|nr:hypothetical protein [Acidobacteriota bacterium]